MTILLHYTYTLVQQSKGSEGDDNCTKVVQDLHKKLHCLSAILTKRGINPKKIALLMLDFHKKYSSFLFTTVFFHIFAIMERIDGKMYLEDSEIYQGLLDEDNDILTQIFEGEQFQTVIAIIKAELHLDHKEPNSIKADIVTGFYWDYLRKDDAKKLREYEIEGGNILIWLAREAMKYLRERRNNKRKKENRHANILTKIQKLGKSPVIDAEDVVSDPEHDLEIKQIWERTIKCINMIKNTKYQEIMRKYYLHDDSVTLSFESSNISVDKGRALNAFFEIYNTLE